MLQRVLLTVCLLSLVGCANFKQRWANLTSPSAPTQAQASPSEMAPRPMAGNLTSTPPPPQPVGNAKVLRAPSDWDELAHDAAYRVSQRATQVSDLKNHLVYVAEPKMATPFAIALRKFLQSNLTQMGIAVAEQASEHSLQMELDVQSLKLASGMQVVVSTAISNGTVYLFRTSEVYRVNHDDERLYDASLLPPVPLPPSETKMMTITDKH